MYLIDKKNRNFKLLIILISCLLAVQYDSQCAKSEFQNNKPNPIRVFDKIYFGTTNNEILDEQKYYDFLRSYEVFLGNNKFYYYQGAESIEYGTFGLYIFGLITTEFYDLNKVKKLNRAIVNVISQKYSNPLKISINNQKQSKSISNEIIKLINSTNGSNIKEEDVFVEGYDKFEYKWEKNGIQILLGYHVDYEKVDKYGNITRVSNNHNKSVGRKIFYRPYLKFKNLKAVKYFTNKIKKNEIEIMKSDIDKF